MMVNFDSLQDASLQADLCIIGAGAAGLLLAHAFVGTGTSVVVAESGERVASPRTQALYCGEVDGRPFRGLQDGRVRSLGGSTTLWGGQCIPLDPIDFEERPWVRHSGWPISQADLQPYYALAKRQLQISPAEYETALWDSFGLDRLAFDPARLNPIHSVYIPRRDLGRRYAAELTAAPNIRVLLGATATELQTDAYGTTMAGARLQSLDGRHGRISARRVVLCGGAIENARLLLLSDRACPGGLGNQHGLVGRFLQEHPFGRAASIHTDQPRRLQTYFNLMYRRQRKRLAKLALSEQAQRRELALNCVARLEYEYAPGSDAQVLQGMAAELRAGRMPRPLLSQLMRVGAGVPMIADTAWRRLVQGFSPAPRPSGIYLETFSEQAPNPESRVRLGRGLDALGQRRVLVEWRLLDIDWHTPRVFARHVQAEFRRLKLGEVRLADWLTAETPPDSAMMDSFHPAGTTRMAGEPKQGVVDRNCQVFGVSGLYAAGSSVFPTSGAANPVLTIAAMTLRLADRLKAELAQRVAEAVTVAAMA
jgi:choline dehydrogenase-like flavoprotein